MNNARRNQIRSVIRNVELNASNIKINAVDFAKVKEFFEMIKNDIEDICNDEEYAFDSMPENLQYSTRGSVSEQCVDTLNEAVELMDDFLQSINSEAENNKDDFWDNVDEVMSLLDDVINY